MAYKACYHCELLFDVDDSGGEVLPCPQCGQALENYHPSDEQALDDELYGEDEVQQSTLLGESVPAPVNPAIVATHAFDGLSASVREQLAARQQSLSTEMAQARPTAIGTPTPAVPGPSMTPAPDPKANATKILDISANQGAIEAMVASADSMPQPTMALDTGAQPASQDARFSTSKSGRHTRIEGLVAPEAPEPPAAPKFSPVETPPPVQRPEAPPPLEPIGVSAGRKNTNPEPRRTANMPAVDVAPPPARTGTQPPSRTTKPPTSAARTPAPSGGSSKLVVILIAALVVLGGGGAAVWYFVLRKPPAPPVETPVEAPKSAEAPADKLAAAMADSQAELPPATSGEAIKPDAPFLVGGPEGLTTSFGGVPGLPSLTLPEPQIDKDAGGEWVKPLKAMFEGSLGANPGRLLMAIDYRADARTVVRLAYSGYKAGFRQFGLGVDRGTDGRGSLPFTLQPAGTPLPPEGAMVVSVGSISVKVDAQDAAGTMLSDGVAVPHKEPGSKPDVDAVAARIETLLKAHPGIKRALVYPNPEMTMEVLAGVLDRVSSNKGKALFSEVSLAIR